MKYRFIAESFDFCLDFAKSEIQSILNVGKVNELDEDILEFFLDEKDLNKLFDLVFYSKSLIGLYIDPLDECYDEHDIDIFDESFEYEIDGEFCELVDIVGFELQNRDYLLNKYDEIPPILVNFGLFLMKNIQDYSSIENIKFLDPVANLGEVLIESSINLNDEALFMKNKHKVMFAKFFGIRPSLKLRKKSSHKFIGVVQDNVDFKQLRENINFSNQKIKISKYEPDWLDTKFKEDEIDLVISYLNDFIMDKENDEIQREFFFQSEYVCSGLICAISKEKLNQTWIDRYKLETLESKEAYIEDDLFYINIFRKTNEEKNLD